MGKITKMELSVRSLSVALFGSLLFVSFSGLAQFRMPACGTYAQFYKGDSINVVTFGASTVEGVPAPLNFQQSLKSFIENCYSGKIVNIYNNGVGGETTGKGLTRFDAAIDNKTGFVMLLMGVNDAIQIERGIGNVDQTVANIRTMIEKAQAKKLDVILGTLQYFLESAGPESQVRLIRRRNSIIHQINIRYKALAAAKGLKIADFNPLLSNRNLYSDDVHPNRRGYYVMALVWFDALNQEIVERYLEATVVQNYPNPANSFTKIGFTLSSASNVTVSLFDMVGKKLGIVFDDYRNAGYHEEEISTARYSPGVYILYYEFQNKRFSKKMIIHH